MTFGFVQIPISCVGAFDGTSIGDLCAVVDRIQSELSENALSIILYS